MMEQDLVNHIEKCRCCFAPFLESTKLSLRITQNTRKKFFDLTRIELPMSEKLSNVICELCNFKLDDFTGFQSLMISNQQRLQKLEGSFKPQIASYDLDDDAMNYQAPSDPFNFECVKVEQDDIKTELSEEDLSSWLEVEPEIVITKRDEDVDVYENRAKSSKSKLRSASTKESRKRKYNKTSTTFQRTKFGEGRKLCPYCAKVVCDFAYSRHVNVHINESNKNYFFCDTCEYKTFSKVNITSHVKNHLMIELRRNYHCGQCSATFTSRCNRQTHEKIMHSDVRRTYKCECGKEFTTQSGLYGHKKKMHEPWKNSCNQCDKVFPTTSKLRHHKIFVHDPKRPCEICGELVPPGMFYNRHLKSHEMLKCTWTGCNKTFSKFSLQRHITTVHLPRKESACSTCSAVFNSEHYLKIHIYRVHSEHRKQCQVDGCDFSTTVRSLLLKHYLKHQGISEMKRDQFMQEIKDTKYKRKNCDWKEKSE